MSNTHTHTHTHTHTRPLSELQEEVAGSGERLPVGAAKQETVISFSSSSSSLRNASSSLHSSPPPSSSTFPSSLLNLVFSSTCFCTSHNRTCAFLSLRTVNCIFCAPVRSVLIRVALVLYHPLLTHITSSFMFLL